MMQHLRARDFLIGFLLALASIQCVGSIYASSVTGYDWHAYALGKAAMPYQGRVAMMPYLRWAERTPWMRRLSARYQASSEVGNKMPEPMTTEKFASFIAALISMLIMVIAAAWYSIRCRYNPWWLTPLLTIMIVTITLAVKAEANYWYVYDLPHAALFGLACICILEGWALPLVVLFAIDTPVRETSVYLIVLYAATALYRRNSKDRLVIGVLSLGMAAYWGAFRLAVHHWFAANQNDTGSRLSVNLHDLLRPHHWSQLLSAGGYLVLPVWLERKRLPLQQRVLLYAALLCVPVTLFYGVWVETRIWLEWTLPLAILAASEWSRYTAGTGLESAAVPNFAHAGKGEESSRF